MTLDISTFEKAINRLEEGLLRYRLDPADLQIRDGFIQRFECTYELGHKTLKRYLEATAAVPEEIERMAFQDQIRTANEHGLLRSDWPKWRTFRDLRAKTSHTYDEDKALQVVAIIPDFLEEVMFLRTQLQQRLH